MIKAEKGNRGSFQANSASLKAWAPKKDLTRYNEKEKIEKENSALWKMWLTGAIFGPPAGSFAFAGF